MPSLLNDDEDTGIPQAEHDKAVNAALDKGRTEGMRDGAKAERDRLSAVLAAPQVKGHEVFALKQAARFPEAKATDIAEMCAELPAPAATSDRKPISERVEATGVNEVGSEPPKAETPTGNPGSKQETGKPWGNVIPKHLQRKDQGSSRTL